MKQDIAELLKNNPYPGRGILTGCSHDGKRSVVIYFTMGRSENSRNRIFAETEDGIRTAAHDPAKMTNPDLVIYHPVRIFNNDIIVTNGDQTDTILDHLKQGSDFRSALMTREFEPDAPNYTPRISAIVKTDGSYSISILKTINSRPEQCLRCFYDYSGVIPGLGHFISTYKTDGDPLPSFSGDPIPVNIPETGLVNFANTIWDALNEENKVSLYAREHDYSTGNGKTIIINKNQ